MKKLIGVSALLLLILFLLPLRLQLPNGVGKKPEPPAPSRADIELLPPGENDANTFLRVKRGDEVVRMCMSDYLACVLRGEMPASYEQDALCAQAVAARTYTRYKIVTGGNHDDADICDNPACCQAFLDEETARKNWGSDADYYETKIENAVAMTDGETMLYNGSPILAVFHASSAGMTRASGDVWENDLPYLQPVESPEPTKSPNYYSRREFSVDAFRDVVREAYPEADLSDQPSHWCGKPTTDKSGSINTISVGGVSISGENMRRLFKLRSSCFEMEYKKDTMVFYVTGYGHGVGMSQNGANEMAKAGKTWKEILTHYYTGVTIAVQTPDESA